MASLHWLFKCIALDYIRRSYWRLDLWLLCLWGDLIWLLVLVLCGLSRISLGCTDMIWILGRGIVWIHVCAVVELVVGYIGHGISMYMYIMYVCMYVCRPWGMR